jgi:hypothetical protein
MRGSLFVSSVDYAKIVLTTSPKDGIEMAAVKREYLMNVLTFERAH